jgi:protein O-GlcNAc transferase
LTVAVGELEAFHAAAQARRDAGDSTGALVLLDEILRRDPDERRALLARTTLLLPIDPVAAANTVHRITRTGAADAEAHGLLGQALSAAGRADEAVAAFRLAVAAQPANGRALANLSIAQLRAGDRHGALVTGRQAVAADPRLAEGHASIGHAAGYLGEHQEAISAFQRALVIAPRNADALVGLARVYRDLGRPSTAILALMRAVHISPGFSSAHVELATYYREIGEFDRAEEASRKARALAPLANFHSNRFMDLLYKPSPDEDAALEEARAWGIRKVTAIPPVAQSPTSDSNSSRPLRIGYVSADLYRHPVGWLGAGAIMAHDRSRFHVSVYANQTARDALTDEIQSKTGAWVPIAGLDDAAVAGRIASDRIDILVDLSGHTAGNRLDVFARRPAPVQVTWLGFPATTGLPTMDYVVMDDDHLADGAQAHFTERVVRLPRIRFAYTPPDYAPAVVDPPMVKNEFVTFGSFNNVSKLNQDVINVWSRVLIATPASRLLLKWRHLADPFMQARIRAVFAHNGVASERIVFDGATPHADMLAQYGQIDIALDPFPFSGGQTSCEALWMGVPVVTLPAARAVSRQTHAMLQAIGRPEWSARSPSGYIGIAAALAADAGNLAAMRRAQRARIGSSPLMDINGLARDLEAVYRDLWRAHVSGAAIAQ